MATEDCAREALAKATALIESSLALLDRHVPSSGASVHLSLGLHHLAREAERRQAGGADISAD